MAFKDLKDQIIKEDKARKRPINLADASAKNKGISALQFPQMEVKDLDKAFSVKVLPENLWNSEEATEVLTKVKRKMVYLNYSEEDITTAVELALRDYNMTISSSESFEREKAIIEAFKRSEINAQELNLHDPVDRYVINVIYTIVQEPVKIRDYHYKSDYVNKLLMTLNEKIRQTLVETR